MMERPNKGMKLTSAERIGRSQLIPGVGPTVGGSRVVRTAYRSRIPKGLAYPLGAEAVSAALASVPQEQELSLSFHFHGRAKDVEDAAHRGDALGVLEVYYSAVAGVLSALLASLREGACMRIKEMKLTSAERLGRSQLIPEGRQVVRFGEGGSG